MFDPDHKSEIDVAGGLLMLDSPPQEKSFKIIGGVSPGKERICFSKSCVEVRSTCSNLSISCSKYDGAPASKSFLQAKRKISIPSILVARLSMTYKDNQWSAFDILGGLAMSTTIAFHCPP